MPSAAAGACAFHCTQSINPVNTSSVIFEAFHVTVPTKASSEESQ